MQVKENPPGATITSKLTNVTKKRIWNEKAAFLFGSDPVREKTLTKVIKVVVDYGRESSTLTSLGIHRRLRMDGVKREVSIAIKLLKNLEILKPSPEKLAGVSSRAMVIDQENFEKYFQVKS